MNREDEFKWLLLAFAALVFVLLWGAKMFWSIK
jgi:hypothetical protein